METRTETSVFKRALRVTLALFMALYFAPGLMAVPQSAHADDETVASNTVTVDDLTALQGAIVNPSVDTIVVSQTIRLSDNTKIDGNGKIIQVETPYVDASGACASGATSSYSIFSISSGTAVELKDMIIYGGINTYENTAGGITLNAGATLNAENLTIARSYRGIYIEKGAKASLTNCNVVRNVSSYGAGVLCSGGTLIMDGCSLSENRSTSQGGGAIEINNNGKFYANNTVIANNCSAEIGGAVNNYNSNVYLMNCTVTGNVTTRSGASGGGIGCNDCSFYAVNSIFKDNKYIPYGTDEPVASDIGLAVSSSEGRVKLSHCIYGAICNSNGNSSTSAGIVGSTCKSISDSSIGGNIVFAALRGDGVLCKESGETSGFTHPALVSKSGVYALYAPLKNDNSNPAVTGGVATYFDKSDLSAVKMSYGDGGSTVLGTLGVAETKVSSYFEGSSRVDGVIGASGPGEVAIKYHTVKLEPAPEHGSVNGLTLHGDSKKAGTDTVSFEVLPDSGYVIGTVNIAKTDDPSTTITPTVNGNAYSFTMPDYDVTVSVSFDALPTTPVTPPAPVTPTPSTPSAEPDPTPSGITASGATDINGNDGVISGVTSQMEYKLEGEREWTPVPAGMTELKGLAPGSYLVRYRGASTYTKVTVAGAPLYKIEVKAAKGGEASTNKTAAAKGEIVTLSAKPAKSYNLRGWMVNGKHIEENTFAMPAADVSVEPVFSPAAKLFTAKAKAYKTKAKLSWKAYPGAAEYKVYVAKPGKKLKKAALLSGDKLSYSAKKLKGGKVYRLRVVAVDENGSKLASSPIVYITPKGGKYANASKLNVASTSMTLDVDQKAKLCAKVATKDAKGKKLLAVKNVAKLRYVSSEPSIVKVSKKGTVTALQSGTAYVYAIAADGVAKRVKVVVA